MAVYQDDMEKVVNAKAEKMEKDGYKKYLEGMK
jgi:hypothetical protein